MSFTATIGTAQVMTLVVNTITDSVVMYASYPYNSFAQFGGRYLAAGPDGLYQIDIGGEDGTTPIAWTFTTGDLMFGSEFVKRISDFYASMRCTGSVKLTVQADEGEPAEYLLSAHDIELLKQRRSPIGKGLRGKYFTFTLTGIDGGNIEFDTMNITAVPTSRRI